MQGDIMAMSQIDPIREENTIVAHVESMIQIGRLREALQQVEQLLQGQEDCYRAWVLKGEIHRQMHDTEEAIEAFRGALRLDPYDDWVIARLAEAYRDAGRSEEALTYVDRALALNRESVFGLAVKGEILRSMGRVEEALALLDRSLQLNASRAVEFARRAESLRQGQYHEESLHYYDSSLTANAHSAWVLACKGEALRSLGELEAALETIDQALELRQRHLGLLGAKAEMLRQVGRYEDALACLDRAKVMHQEKSRMVASKAMVLRDLGEIAAADQLLVRAIDLQPDDPYFWWLRGHLLDREGRWEEALPCLARVVKLNPSHTEAVATCVRLLWQQESFDQARKMLRHYMTLREDDWGFFLAALVELRSGSFSTATPLLNRALRMAEACLRQEVERGGRVWRTFNLALYHLVAGEISRAEALYSAMLREATPKELRDAAHDLHFVQEWDVLRQKVTPFVRLIEEELANRLSG